MGFLKILRCSDLQNVYVGEVHWQSWEGVIAVEVSLEEGLQLQLWRHQQDNVWHSVITERKIFEF